MVFGNNNYNNLNGNNNLNNNARFVGITLACLDILMKTYRNLWSRLCSYENLELAWKKARKHKTLKQYVIEFEENLQENLLLLRTELLLHSYRPRPLKTFILRDPKTRRISKSDFRDRVIHHALCNIIEPIFENAFIHDSYANRIGKGTLKAIERFDYFKRKITDNNSRKAFVLKADIKHYFETVDHKILSGIINRKIQDKNVLCLIRKILSNYSSKEKGKGSENQRFSGLSSQAQKGMPLGNLTSQFFANVYLDELDQFVKHKLKASYYIRYVDDFIIFETNKSKLSDYKQRINQFLNKIKLELHPDKSRIASLDEGVCFLGFRIFPHHKLLKKSNIIKMRKKLILSKEQFGRNEITYNEIYASMEGWLVYAHQGSTFNLRKEFTGNFEELFSDKIADVEIDRWLKNAKQMEFAR